MLSSETVPHLEHFIAIVPVQAVSLSHRRRPQTGQRFTLTISTLIGLGFVSVRCIVEFIHILHNHIDQGIGIPEIAASDKV